MQELSLLGEKVVNGGVLVTGNAEARSAFRNTDNIKWGPRMPGTSPWLTAEERKAFLESARKKDPYEEKYAWKKVKTASGEWVDFAPIR